MIRRLVLCLLLLCAPMASSVSAQQLDAPKDILGTALDAGTFTIFLAGVKVAGLTDLLSGEGPLTLFAPTDDAFAKLPRGSIQMLLLPENHEKMRAILMHHLVIGRIVARDFLGKRMEAATASGDLVLIDASKSVAIGPARLVKADVVASNGVLHVIDTVIVPKEIVLK